MPTTYPLRIIFAGTPEFAATALNALIKNNFNIIAVYTQPDRPAGRGRQLKASPVKEVATQQAIPVYQPANFKQLEDIDQLVELSADLMIVAAYGLILPIDVLAAPKQGCINIHASLLPRWRGAAPIQRAILAGDKQTGITIMQMDKGLDTGDMLLTKTCEISDTDTGSSLHDKLAELGASTTIETLELLQANNLKPVKQDDSQACYAHKLSKEEALINWQQPAEQIARQVRAFNSWPVAQTHFNNKTIRIWQATAQGNSEIDSTSVNTGKIAAVNKDGIQVICQQGMLNITELQLAGAKRMAVKDLLNGKPDLFQLGQRFN